MINRNAWAFCAFVILHSASGIIPRFTIHDSRAFGAPMHLDFANLLNLVSTVTLIGALVFTGLQVRAANRARREQAAVTVIETAALSENSARFLETAQLNSGRRFRCRHRKPGSRNQAPDLFVRTSGWKSSATWFFTVWWMFRPLTILPVVRSSVSGRERKLVGRATEAHEPRRVFGMVRMARDTNRAISCHATLCSCLLASRRRTGIMRRPL